MCQGSQRKGWCSCWLSFFWFGCLLFAHSKQGTSRNTAPCAALLLWRERRERTEHESLLDQGKQPPSREQNLTLPQACPPTRTQEPAVFSAFRPEERSVGGDIGQLSSLMFCMEMVSAHMASLTALPALSKAKRGS